MAADDDDLTLFRRSRKVSTEHVSRQLSSVDGLLASIARTADQHRVRAALVTANDSELLMLAEQAAEEERELAKKRKVNHESLDEDRGDCGSGMDEGFGGSGWDRMEKKVVVEWPSKHKCTLDCYLEDGLFSNLEGNLSLINKILEKLENRIGKGVQTEEETIVVDRFSFTFQSAAVFLFCLANFHEIAFVCNLAHKLLICLWINQPPSQIQSIGLREYSYLEKFALVNASLVSKIPSIMFMHALNHFGIGENHIKKVLENAQSRESNFIFESAPLSRFLVLLSWHVKFYFDLWDIDQLVYLFRVVHLLKLDSFISESLVYLDLDILLRTLIAIFSLKQLLLPTILDVLVDQFFLVTCDINRVLQFCIDVPVLLTKKISFEAKLVQMIAYRALFKLFNTEYDNSPPSLLGALEFLHAPVEISSQRTITALSGFGFAERRQKSLESNIHLRGLVDVGTIDIKGVSVFMKIFHFLPFLSMIDASESAKNEFYSYCAWTKRALPSFNTVFLELRELLNRIEIQQQAQYASHSIF